MSPEQVEALTKNIIDQVNGAADLVGVIDPALIPLIAIGKAVDKLVPGIAGTVANWIAGNPPTAEERADFKAKLAVLSDPNLP